MSFDVIVIGGGAVGLSCARELARAGKKVALLDAGAIGREASWAAGGILSPVNPHAYPPSLVTLVERSVALYPDLARDLERESGVSIELRKTGLLRLALDEDDEHELAQSIAFRKARGLATSGPRPASELSRLFKPGLLSSNARSFVQEPEIAQVRTPRLLRALEGACLASGVALSPFEPVTTLLKSSRGVSGVRTTSRTIEASEVVLAAGAWSAELLRTSLGLEVPVTPVRGQIALLATPSGTLPTMVLGAGGRYLIPRSDGRVLVGSTLEHVGFDRRTTVEGIACLLQAAIRLAPGLSSARVETQWAGLRPGSPDRLPFLGRVRGVAGLVVATGHYRNGIVLAAVTAEVVSQLIRGDERSIDLEPFSVERAVSS